MPTPRTGFVIANKQASRRDPIPKDLYLFTKVPLLHLIVIKKTKIPQLYSPIIDIKSKKNTIFIYKNT